MLEGGTVRQNGRLAGRGVAGRGVTWRGVTGRGVMPGLVSALRRGLQQCQRVWPAALLTIVCLGILCADLASTLSARDRLLGGAQDATANLTRVLASHAESTLRVAELTVSALVERMERDGHDRAMLATVHVDLGVVIETSGWLQDAIVIDRDGRFLVSAKSTFGDSSGAAEALEWHRERPLNAIHVGPPVKDWLAAGWSIPVSRRLNEANGSFAGVAVVTIDVDYFVRFYRTLRLGKRGTISLTTGAGQMLVRSASSGAMTGQDVSQYPFFRGYVENGPVGTLTASSPLDHIVRQGHYRAVSGYPLVVFVGMAIDDVLEGWWWDSLLNGVVVLLLVLCTALLGVRLGRLVRSHGLTACAAQASERLYRLLAVNGTDVIVQLDPDLRRRYVSPASRDVLGYAPEILIGRSPQHDMHPDDWTAVANTMAALRGTDAARTVTFRFRRADATFLWVEASIRWLRDDGGYVVALRDVSERVATQAKLHEANVRLQRLVMLDGLTGIANRRCLDKFLEREFRRASREEVPLSVLMIDADRFKAFNDTYGHQAGDECLRAIAGTLQRSMRRAADLASRFGGEEFVVMLPHTDQAGANAMAEMIRAEIELLAIPHEGSITGLVTVSIGVATAMPGRDAPSATTLLAAADAALYEAKNAGRNCVAAAGPLNPLSLPIQLEPIMELDF